MATSRSGWSTAFTVAVFIGIPLACSGIRPDELDCEDAVGHLQQCCPGFTANDIKCVYDDFQGCGDDDSLSLPDFSTTQSACIRGESCSELRSSGVCERAMQILPSLSEPSSYTGRGVLQVCP